MPYNRGKFGYPPVTFAFDVETKVLVSFVTDGLPTVYDDYRKVNGMLLPFHVVVEREAHQWRAYCPAFESYEASTGGQTREEALAHIHSVIFITLEQILAQGALVPVDVEIPNGTLISVEI